MLAVEPLVRETAFPLPDDLSEAEYEESEVESGVGWRSEEAKRKRAETVAFNAQMRREDVVLLYRRGAVPLAVADILGVNEGYVIDVLLASGIKVPRWLRNDLYAVALKRGEGNEVPEL